MGGREWTNEEDAWLRKNYLKLGGKGCYKAGRLDKTLGATYQRAQLLGLARRQQRENGVLGKGYERNHCIDCGAEVSPKAIRCQSCDQKRRWTDAEYRSQNIETVKAAWERGAIGDEECRRKQSEAIKAAWKRGDMEGIHDEACLRKRSESLKAAWKRGDFDDRVTEEYLRKRSDVMKAAWERGCFDGVFISPTSIELQVAAALDILGIGHQPQYRPDGYSRVYDEFIPPDTLIEINGDYFHSDENFPGIEQRDAEKAQWATDNGYKLVTIWEHEINEVGAWALVMQRVAGIEEDGFENPLGYISI